MIRLNPARSLRLRLVIASLLVQLMMLAALVANSVRLQQEALLEQTELRVKNLAPLLNAALARPLAQGDQATLDEILRTSRLQQGLAYLKLTDRSGKVVAFQGSEEVKSAQLADQPTVSRYETPIILAGQSYGRLRYGVSTAFLESEKKRLLAESVLIAATEVVLTAILLLAAGFWLTRHLRELTYAGTRMAEGDYSTRVPVASQDEVGELALAFNAMAQAVQDHVKALKRVQGTQQKYMGRAREEQARLLALLSAMNIGILFVGRDRRILYANPAFHEIWKLPGETLLIGLPVDSALAGARTAIVHSAPALPQTPLYGMDVVKSAEIELSDGRLVTENRHPVWDDQERQIGQLWIYEDVTRERQRAEQLVYLAERDSLTGLYNRHRFREELNRLLADAERRGTKLALLLFDLDEFKHVNDTFGHRAGDAILVQVAAEVGPQIRRNEVFVRLGGDEFAVLAPETSDIEGLAKRIVTAIARIRFSFEGRMLRLSGSAGVAVFPDHAATAEDLIARADTAMYFAKEAGKNTWRLYRPQRDASRRMAVRLGWNERIRHALEHDLLRLHFQGVHAAVDGRLAHLEALVRMVDTEGKLILPGLFIPIAEKAGTIVDIDRWVILSAIRALRASPAIPGIAVNISGRSFDDPMLPSFITQALRSEGVASSRLLVELTETSAVADLHDAKRFISTLRRAGCRVCLDDFGAGFSSFAYLKHLEVDVLKIDGQFIRNLVNDPGDQVFVKAIVDVASGLRIETVAECVEDQTTLEMLRAFRVNLVQGYHLGKPMAAPAALLASQTDHAAA